MKLCVFQMLPPINDEKTKGYFCINVSLTRHESQEKNVILDSIWM